MLEPDNWARVRKTIGISASGADKTTLSDAAKGVRANMEFTGVSMVELEDYMRGRNWLGENMRWHSADQALLEGMADDDNWDKVLKSIKKARKA
jgi:hypothetical protein